MMLAGLMQIAKVKILDILQHIALDAQFDQSFCN